MEFMADTDTITEEIEEFEIDLSELDNEELEAFHENLVASYNEKRAVAESDEDVAELAAIKEAILTVRQEVTERIELAADDDIVNEDFSFDDLHGDEELEEEETEVAAESIQEKGAPNVVISPKGIEGDRPGDASVTASAKPLARIASDVQGFTAGQAAQDWNAVAKAFIAKHPSTRTADVSSGARFLVASVDAEYPEDRVLGDDPVVNTRKIEAVTSVEAITASGGLCAPLTPWYNLQVYGDVCRPLRDSLPAFKADRGGIRYVTPPKLSNLAGSTRRTTAAQDAAGYTNQTPAGTTAPKPCLHVTCGAENTCIVQAVSSCLTFGNFGSRTYPEQVEAWLRLARVEFARYQEQELLAAINAGSTQITATQVYGANFSLLEQIGYTVDSFKARYRICGTQPLNFVAPFWLKSILKNDIAAQHPGDGLSRFAISDAQVEDWLRSRGVRPIWTQDTLAADPQFANPSAGAIGTYPDAVRWFIFPEGQWLWLDNGTLDLGLVRDSTLNSQNDYQIWMEEFSGICQVGGIESLAVVSDLCANGTYAPADELRTCS